MDTNSTISPESLDQALLGWMQELSPHGICVTDVDLRVLGWNLWLETSSGLKRAEVVGRRLVEIFPTLPSPRLETYFDRALAGEVVVLSAAFHGFLFPFPSPISDAGESNMLQTARIAPLVQHGEIVGTITTIEDVTEREYQNALLRRQHERQELLSWALAHLLESSNPESIIKEIFPRISAHIEVDVYFNYLLESDGKHLRLHSSGGCHANLQKEVATLELGESACGSTALERKSLVLSEVQQSTEVKAQSLKKLGLRSYVCHPLLVEDKLIGTLSFGSTNRDRFEPDEIEFTRIFAQYVAVAIDRSHRVEELCAAQRELSQHADSLEKKVAERTASLEESFSELQSFSYSLAHDVRAPLRHIRGYATLLMEDCATRLDAQAQGYVASILRGMENLDALTNDILTYSQVSQSFLHLVPIDLETLLSDIVTQHPALAVEGVFTIEHPLQNPIAQGVLLGQCLSNLIDNALKFSRAGVSPKIVIRTELIQGIETGKRGEIGVPHPIARLSHAPDSTEDSSTPRWVRIWVEDNGIGIPPQFYAKIFEIFERLNTQTEYKGTGIGLAIVAKAVHRMGGHLGVDSKIGRGSKFWFQLPAA
ncbi:MAG: ATP-binding protein [Verrucomicrobiota bacterium]